MNELELENVRAFEAKASRYEEDVHRTAETNVERTQSTPKSDYASRMLERVTLFERASSAQ